MAAATAKSSIEELLNRGLDFYAMNRWQDAARCWNDALALDADDPRPREYLAALSEEGHGAPAEPASAAEPDGPVRLERRESAASGLREMIEQLAGSGAAGQGGSPFDKNRFLAMLRDRKFEEALDVLYRVREAAPTNASVSRSIQVLKDKLLSDYLATIGPLDLVPRKTDAAPGLLAADLPTPADNTILRLVDGIATAEDILASSSAGPFSSSRALARLVEKGILAMGGPAAALPARPVPEPAQEAAPAPANSSYEELFREATHAYLRRDLDRALELFLECQRARPDDRRVAHNIQRLQQRLRSP